MYTLNLQASTDLARLATTDTATDVPGDSGNGYSSVGPTPAIPTDRNQTHSYSGEPPAARVAVIGGGPAGLAAAARLIDAGMTVELFEAGEELGGLARSISLWGCQLELSAHIFLSPDPFVNKLWQESAGELKEISLQRGIFDGQRITEYPITPLRVLRNLGVFDSIRSGLQLIAGRFMGLAKHGPKTAEDWMVRTYGRTLHNRFLRDYAEKLWGTTCDQIDARFPQFLFQSADSSKGGRQTFLYPREGNSSVWKRLGERLIESGVKIHRKTPVSKLDISDNKITGLIAGGKQLDFDHIISTMPMGLLARLAVSDEPGVLEAASTLRARSTVLVYLRAKDNNQSSFNWLSVYPADYQVGRITDFGRWLDNSDGTTVYCLEFWCDREDEFWNRSDTSLAELACSELNKTDLVGTVVALDSHVERVPGTHPVFSVGSQAAIDTIKDALNEIDGLSTVGRHGAHGVLGMGESMVSACVAADRVIAGIYENRGDGGIP